MSKCNVFGTQRTNHLHFTASAATGAFSAESSVSLIASGDATFSSAPPSTAPSIFSAGTSASAFFPSPRAHFVYSLLKLCDGRFLRCIGLFQDADVSVGTFDRCGFRTVALHSSVAVLLLSFLTIVVPTTTVRHELLGAGARRRGNQGLHFFQGVVDAIATALLGNFVRSAFAGETC
jgi:hypothetical protein